jgi:hypothetical protein
MSVQIYLAWLIASFASPGSTYHPGLTSNGVQFAPSDCKLATARQAIIKGMLWLA